MGETPPVEGANSTAGFSEAVAAFSKLNAESFSFGADPTTSEPPAATSAPALSFGAAPAGGPFIFGASLAAAPLARTASSTRRTRSAPAPASAGLPFAERSPPMSFGAAPADGSPSAAPATGSP